ncbi:Uncharacterised protein [Shigella sonnei]|nr:Uncharacterised protein [Shigella sonnei]
MKIEAKIVFPYGAKQLAYRRRRRARGIVFTINQLFTVGGLYSLVFKLQPRQFDPYHCQPSGPHQRPDDSGNHQTIRNVPDNRQLRHMRGERYQHRQEGDQRHDGVDKTDAHILQR